MTRQETAANEGPVTDRGIKNSDNREGKMNNGSQTGEDIDRSGSVDKIREIIFGSQMRDYEKTFARLEARLIKESSDLREDINRHLAALEATMKAELASLTEAGRKEQADRIAACKEPSDTAGAFKGQTEANAAQAAEHNAKVQREIRQLILDEAKRLAQETEQKNAALTAELRKEAAEIRGMLTNRNSLATLFTEVASRLKQDGGSSGK